MSALCALFHCVYYMKNYANHQEIVQLEELNKILHLQRRTIEN